MEKETPSSFYQASHYTSRISDGLEEDIEKLIQKFVDADTLRFETFTKIWKEMKFSLIFIGRPLVPEVAEFVEEALHMSKKSLVDVNNSIHMRVAALYLVYAIAYRQPIHYFAKIHLTAEESKTLVQLQSHARQYGHFDILFVMGRLLIDGLIEFHITEWEYGAEKSLRKYYEGPLDGTFIVNGKKTARLPRAAPIQKTLTSLSQLEEYSKRYQNIKRKIEGDAHAPSTSLSYVDVSLPVKLAQGLRAIMHGVQSTDDMEKALEEVTQNDEEESSASVLHNRRQEIRDRAQMKTDALPQHLVTVKEKPEDNVINIDSEKSTSLSAVSTSPPKKKSKKKNGTHSELMERRIKRYGVLDFKKLDEI